MAKLKRSNYEWMANGSCRRRAVVGGKRRYFQGKTMQEVEDKIAAALANEADRAERARIEEENGPLFEEVCASYRGELDKMKPGTISCYLPCLVRCEQHFSGYRMREIKPYMIHAFLSGLPFTAATTVSNHKTVLNNVYQHWINHPVWQGDINIAKATTMPRGLTRGKRKAPDDSLVQLVKDNYLDPDALLAVAYLCTGERRGEMLAIRLQDIDFAKKQIHICGSVSHATGNRPVLRDYTKTPAGLRTIPLLSMFEEALEPYRTMPPGTYIIGLQDTPVTETQYREIWLRFWKKHGVATSDVRRRSHIDRRGVKYLTNVTVWHAPVCGHQFRHEYVCQLCMAGVEETIAVQLVGHANAKMIHEVYMDLKPAMLEGARQKLDAILG